MASLQTAQTCPCCGATDFEDDYTHGVAVCTSCGTTVGDVSSSIQDPQPPQSRYSQHEPSLLRIRVFSDKHYSSQRQDRLLNETRKVAAAMKLPLSKTKICLEQAKEMCRRQVVGQRGFRIEVISAVLVYLAWKNENPSVSAQDMINIGVKTNVLIKATARLCKQHPDMFGQGEEPVSDEERLESRLDRIFPIHGEERRRVISVSLDILENTLVEWNKDIWSMVTGIKVQKKYIHKIPTNDYCILVVALQYVTQKNLKDLEIQVLAENISITPKSLQTRIWVINKALLQLAALCPSLEEDVKRKAITTLNVHRYIGKLLKNKDYLLYELKLLREEEEKREYAATKETDQVEVEKTKKSRKRKRPLLPNISQVLNGELLAEEEGGEEEGGRGGVEEEEDENLSDLDDEIEEYILTEEQVKLRKLFMSLEDSELPATEEA